MSASNLSPNMKVIKAWVEASFDGITHVGVYNCRRISGSQTYSQHSWPNAIDIHVTNGTWTATPAEKAVGDAIFAALLDKFGDHLKEKLWWTMNHWNHIHVSTYPYGYSTPPCAGGAQRIKFKDGHVEYAAFPLTISPPPVQGGGNEGGDDDMALKRNDKGGAVRKLQNGLLGWDADILPQWGADRDFGAETENAVKAFQAAFDLPVTGQADGITFSLIMEFLPDRVAKPVPVRDDQARDLANKALDALGRVKETI